MIRGAAKLIGVYAQLARSVASTGGDTNFARRTVDR